MCGHLVPVSVMSTVCCGLVMVGVMSCAAAGGGSYSYSLQSAPRCFCCFPSQRTRGFVIRWSLRRGREAGTRLQPSFTIACNFERSFILMAHTRPFPYLCAFLSQSVETICNAEPGPGPGYATLQPGTRGRGHTSMARLPSGATLVTISSLTHNRQHSNPRSLGFRSQSNFPGSVVVMVMVCVLQQRGPESWLVSPPRPS